MASALAVHLKLIVTVNVYVELSDGSIDPKLATVGWPALNTHVCAVAGAAHDKAKATSACRKALHANAIRRLPPAWDIAIWQRHEARGPRGRREPS